VQTPDDWMTLRVTASRIEAADVRSFVLADPDGAPLPAWTPGAHVDVCLDAGLVRQYSLCGAPEDRGSYRIAVLREEAGRGGSRFLHDRVRTGDVLRVRAPRNNFPLVAARRYLFLAGGIGITPLLPMIGDVHGRGAEWQLYYGGRRRARMAFRAELAEHAEPAGHGGRVRVLPEDEHGLLPLPEILGLADAGTEVYCCGPEPLLAAVERTFTGPPDALHVERFHPREDAGTGSLAAFEVVLASTGATVRVGPDESIMDALGAAGVDVLSSCREGTCASCETTVLDGEVDHRDSVLSEAERATGKTMMVCVSRARSSRLVLDL
jgi:ferredoxin-NADP reductase